MLAPSEIDSLATRVKGLRALKDPSKEDVEAASEQLWGLTQKAIRHTAALQAEIDAINQAFDRIWSDQQLLVQKLAHLSDPALVPIYNHLIRLKNGLSNLRKKSFYSTDDVLRYQVELGRIEELYVRDGIFYGETQADTTTKQTEPAPSGQAILSSLLHECHRLTRILLENICPVARQLVPVFNRLKAIHAELTAMRQLKAAEVDLTVVASLQRQLREIDSSRENGIFHGVARDRQAATGILEGQAELHYLMNECYDMLSEIRVDATAAQEGIVSAALEAAVSARDELTNYVKTTDAYKLEEEVVTAITGKVADALEFVKSKISSDVESANGLVASALQQTYSRASNALAILGGLDPSLVPVLNELEDIRESLRALHRSTVETGDLDTDKLVDLQRRLGKIDSARVNGVFQGISIEAAASDPSPVPEPADEPEPSEGAEKIPAGQAWLHTVLNECYVLVDLLNYVNV